MHLNLFTQATLLLGLLSATPLTSAAKPKNAILLSEVCPVPLQQFRIAP